LFRLCGSHVGPVAEIFKSFNSGLMSIEGKIHFRSTSLVQYCGTKHVPCTVSVSLLLLLCGLLASPSGAALIRSGGGPVNFLPVFVGYPYGQQRADFSKPGGRNYVFRGTVTDANVNDIVTMDGLVFGSPFTFTYSPGNPAQFEVRAANLGPADIGSYAVEFTAYDNPARTNYSIAAINIIVIPEPCFVMLLGGLAAGLLARRRMAGGTA
jgi:hypothetical protein